MPAGSEPLPSYPEFRHQLEALLRKMHRDDLDAVGATLRRGGFKMAELEAEQRMTGGRGTAKKVINSHAASTYHAATSYRLSSSSGGSSGRAKSIDFSRASPLSAVARQTGSVRIPHLDIKRVSRTVVPRSTDGRTHPRYPPKNGLAAAHHDYVTRGSVADFRTHHDYITRITAVEALDTAMLIDILDMEEDRKLQNDLAIFSNIPGGRERERSLFEAAERCERAAKGGTLQVSTRHVDDWMLLAMRGAAPGWVRKAATTLRHKRTSLEKRAQVAEKPMVDVTVDIAKVTLEQAYEYLTWCDSQSSLPMLARPTWKAGPCGRVQTRFVAELPRGLKPNERRTLLEKFCERLDEEGWMLVGAIHRPDKTNNLDNFHFHVDAYDRPSQWLTADRINEERHPKKRFEGEGCWDFEYSERKRNGKLCYPYRSAKIEEPIRDIAAEGRKPIHHRAAGERYLKALRAYYVRIVNDVVAGRAGSPVYLTGTYKDAEIHLTPMVHLGPENIAKESRGEKTPGGSRNAHIRFNDEMCSLLESADRERIDINRTAEGHRGSGSEIVLRTVERWRSLAIAAVTAQCQAAMIKVVERMVRSRAETVLCANTANKAVRNKATQWLAEIDALTANPGPEVTASQRLRQLNADIDTAWADVLALNKNDLGPLRYVPDQLTKMPPLNAISPDYLPETEKRLTVWLVKHVSSPSLLRFVPNGYIVDHAVPKAIHRLFRLLGDEPVIQKMLLAERQRRENMPASMAEDRRPVEWDCDGGSASPRKIAYQVPLIEPLVSDFAQTSSLVSTMGLQELAPREALPTSEEPLGRGKLTTPSNAANEIAATAAAAPTSPVSANNGPVAKALGPYPPDARHLKQPVGQNQSTSVAGPPVEPTRRLASLHDRSEARSTAGAIRKPLRASDGYINSASKKPVVNLTDYKIGSSRETTQENNHDLINPLGIHQPSRRAMDGFKPIRGLARMCALPSLGMDDRSKRTDGVLPRVPRDHVREGRGGQVDISMRSPDAEHQRIDHLPAADIKHDKRATLPTIGKSIRQATALGSPRVPGFSKGPTAVENPSSPPKKSTER